MLDQFLRDDAAVQRMWASPLGAQLDSFAAVLSALGYARASIRDRLWTVAALGRWLKRRGLSATREATAAFLRRRASRSRIQRGAAATRRLFLEHLEANGVIPASPDHDQPDAGRSTQSPVRSTPETGSGSFTGHRPAALVCTRAISAGAFG